MTRDDGVSPHAPSDGLLTTLESRIADIGKELDALKNSFARDALSGGDALSDDRGRALFTGDRSGAPSTIPPFVSSTIRLEEAAREWMAMINQRMGELRTEINRLRTGDVTPQIENLEKYFDKRFEPRWANIEKLSSTLTKHQQTLQKFDRQRRTRAIKALLIWVLLLAAVVGFVSYLVLSNWANKPDVSIDFNVGEIIGGLLGGIGVLVAGVAYATTRSDRSE